MDVFIKCAELLSKLAGIVSTALIASAVLVTTEMVFVRYILKSNTVWQTEFVVFALAAATFIGAPYVLLKKKHVNVDIVIQYLSPKGQAFMAIIADCCALVFLIILFGTSIQLLVHSWIHDLKTPTLWSFPMWRVYLFLPLGVGLLILQYLANMLSTLYSGNLKGN